LLEQLLVPDKPASFRPFPRSQHHIGFGTRCNMAAGSDSATRLPETSLWANRKCLMICAIVAVANMQYGLDSACLASLQAMPGFLKVFGYPDPTLAGGYGIDVGSTSPLLASTRG
jgi:hypothetical protein